MANTYTFDYTSTSNPDSYPMPDITYAVVPTAPQPAATATAMKSLLTDLVTYSHSGGTIPLPAGYVPLPTDLYITALSEISSAITTQSAAPTGSTTSPPARRRPTGGTSADSGSVSSSDGSSFVPLGTTPTSSETSLPLSSESSLPFDTASSTGTAAAPRRAPVGIRRTSDAHRRGLRRFDTVSRLLLPLIVLLALACLIAGPLLLLGPGARRRRSDGGPS